MEQLIRNLYAVNELSGCSEEEIDIIRQVFGKLPTVLENFYRTVAETEAIHRVQDQWMLPQHFEKYSWLHDPDCLIILNENQGVCQAGIRREDLNLSDPPVYAKTDDGEWELCAQSTGEFLMGMLGYEAAFSMEFMPEAFYWITADELEVIRKKMNKLPYEVHNWLYDMEITLYSNAPDNIVAVMDCGGDIQVLYGSSSEEGYEKLMEVMNGMGEEI